MRAESQQRLKAIFKEVFALPDGMEISQVRQLDPASWDSLGHVTLMAALEAEFEIALDTGEMLELTSYAAVCRFLDSRGI